MADAGEDAPAEKPEGWVDTMQKGGAPLTAQLKAEAQAMHKIAETLVKLDDDEKAKRVLGAVAVLHGFADWRMK